MKAAAPSPAPAAPPQNNDALRAAAAGCRECPLGEPATQTVWGEGALAPALMLVGEQPGDAEDLQGRPFVGPAGRLLDQALQQAGLPREALYVTNAVKHFKFELRGKRRMHKTPAQREVGRTVTITREHGQWLQRPEGPPVLVTWHPSALLRMPREDFDAAYAAWVEDLRVAASADAAR
ncbi:uracil-DNA glycosylase family protein [Aquincola tertiaricarbonis]|uniref:uracil-DNA glycosylase family protein n=1 Tax=Aquincola tertiaricarbonis TaxID=391953 RepID=UPI000697F7E0|nr:uracil-DNA glycosylase family protein [Aquincola tertiaricarbonis]